MQDDMSRYLIRGTITNMETGEDNDCEHFMYSNDAKIGATVQIIKLKHYIHPDDSMQISVICHALDSLGYTFNLSLEFNPETLDMLYGILGDLTENLVLYAEGVYTVGQGGAITIYDADYYPLDQDIELVAREAFRVNNQNDISRG